MKIISRNYIIHGHTVSTARQFPSHQKKKLLKGTLPSQQLIVI
jgi:hypothetical protein